MKLTYALATLAVAGISLGANAEETNLMAGAITGNQALTTPEAPWLAYNTNTGQTGSGDGWQFRAQSGGMNDEGEAAQLFLRWNGNNSVWVYAYEVELEGGFSYTFTCDATTNDNKNNSLLVATSTSLADAVQLRANTLAGTSSYTLDGTDSGSLWTDPVKVSKEFSTVESGKYYLLFYCTNQGGNIIVRIANTSLVKGEEAAADYEALFNDLKTEVHEYLMGEMANEKYSAAVEIYLSTDKGMELVEMAEGDAVPENYEEAYKALSALFAEAKADLPAFYAWYDQYQIASKVIFECEEADEELIGALVRMCFSRPANADAARAGAEALIPAYRAVAQSNAILGIENAEDVTDLIVNPLEGESGNEGWNVDALEGYETVGTIRSNQGEGYTLADGTMVNPYFDSDNWGTSQWGVDFNQVIADLPTGMYRLSVYARGNAGISLYELYAALGETDGETTVYEDMAAVDIEHVGSGKDLNVFGYGWNVAYLDFFIDEPASVRIGVRAGIDASNNWLSFNNFQLVRVSDEAPEISLPMVIANDELVEDDEIITGTSEEGVEIRFNVREGLKLYTSFEAHELATAAEDTELDEDADALPGYTLYSAPIVIKESGIFSFYGVENGIRSEIKHYTVEITEVNSVEGIELEAGEAEYYTLSGVRVCGDLEKGVYIVRKGGKTYKVVIK